MVVGERSPDMAVQVSIPANSTGEIPRSGDPLVDEYLAFVAARARPNTLLAQAFDLRVFFAATDVGVCEVSTADVLAFINSQRAPRSGGNVVRLSDREAGVAASTIKRRLATVSGLYCYLAARGLVASNPVPRGLATRRAGSRGVPLIRAARHLPRVLSPVQVNDLVVALRTDRDRAMVAAMVLGGLRRCEVLGLSLTDIRPGDKRLRITHGKGGHERIVPLAGSFFTVLGAYLDAERPTDSPTDSVFVVLKGPRRGHPLSAAGVDEILSGARRRAGLAHATCHELRHTCFTRLREAGMALEAIQAQAGHASIDTTRIYLHLSNDWLYGVSTPRRWTSSTGSDPPRRPGHEHTGQRHHDLIRERKPGPDWARLRPRRHHRRNGQDSGTGCPPVHYPLHVIGGLAGRPNRGADAGLGGGPGLRSPRGGDGAPGSRCPIRGQLQRPVGSPPHQPGTISSGAVHQRRRQFGIHRRRHQTHVVSTGPDLCRDRSWPGKLRAPCRRRTTCQIARH